MWCTPSTGMPRANASALPKLTPTSSAPTSPGPFVTAMRSVLGDGALRYKALISRFLLPQIV